MSQKLTVSRAARLVGVSRATLQRLIRSGELPVADGWVATDDLMKVFPALSLEDSGMFEKVSLIREQAFGRRIREHVLPSAQVLAQRLFVQSEELAEVRSHLQAYHRLIVETLAQQHPVRESLEQGLALILGSEPVNPLEAMSDMIKVVSTTVQVRPSGREFVAVGNDSILQAGLKAGLGFGYGCGSGNCGLCKARLVSGSVRQVMPADYRLSELERQQGHLLMCANMPLGDLVIETLEAGGAADIPHQTLAARVRSVERLGEDTRLLHLQTPRSSRLRFLAGQSVQLSIGDDRSARPYPLASCPCDDRNLHFHVARDEADPLARRLFAGAIVRGDELEIDGPSGDFVLAPEIDRALVFVAADTGFAPIKSLIEHAIAVEADDPIRLFWSASRADGHYLSRQCVAWADAFDGFEYVETTASGPETGAAQVLSLLGRLGELPHAAVYVSGPAGFVSVFERALSERRIEAAQWHFNPVGH